MEKRIRCGLCQADFKKRGISPSPDQVIRRMVQFRHPFVAFRPALAFQDVGFALRLARPHPAVQHPKGHAAFAHSPRRMQVHPVLSLIAQPAQTRDTRLAGEVQFGRILTAQHARFSRHPRHRRFAVGLQHGPPVHHRVVQQPIGRLRFRHAPARDGNALRRMSRQVIDQPNQPLRQTRISQRHPREFFNRPSHETINSKAYTIRDLVGYGVGLGVF